MGIDPGFGRTGFGLVDIIRRGNVQFHAVDWGVIETSKELAFGKRLEQLYGSILELLQRTNPQIVVMEKFFYARNLNTGIKVAEARGVITLCLSQYGLPVFELSPKQVKTGVCGSGSASKGEVQRMVQTLLGLQDIPRPDDAADALAVAISGSSFID